MDESVYNNDDWREIREGKPGKILARISGTPEIGYFRPGPSIHNANDFIVSRIGRELGLPVAKVQFLNFGGVLGSVSFKVAVEAQAWSCFPFKNEFVQHLSDVSDLAATATFDLWIFNEDRNHENLLYSKNLRTQKYDVHLIDNTHTLCGPSWPSTRDPARFAMNEIVKIEEIRAVFTKEPNLFLPFIERVEKVENDFLGQIIALVPHEFIAEDVRAKTLELLILRKEALRAKINEFFPANI